jgi:hypothetical protein
MYEAVRKIWMKVLLYLFKSPYKRHSIGLVTWSTKSYEKWLILQNLLYLTRPAQLVELGAGRSTYYLAEYALKFSAKVVSIEQHLYYCLKINTALKLSFLPAGIVKYAPIRGDWYDVNRVKKYLLPFNNIDFLYVDGPTILSHGRRESRSFYNSIPPFLGKVKMIMVDDVDREESNEMAGYLRKGFSLKRYDVKGSEGEPVLAILLDCDAAKKVSELPSYLRNLLIPVE